MPQTRWGTRESALAAHREIAKRQPGTQISLPPFGDGNFAVTNPSRGRQTSRMWHSGLPRPAPLPKLLEPARHGSRKILPQQPALVPPAVAHVREELPLRPAGSGQNDPADPEPDRALLDPLDEPALQAQALMF